MAEKKSLVIVESPAKAKTINKYLGNQYKVEASMGHIIDLPKSRIAVDFENNFEPDYITIRGKGKILETLRKEAKKSKEILLASDEDREGEAIAYHIRNAILEKNPGAIIKRIVFNEITKSAILEAIKQPKEIDIDKVNAQKARRVLDRIVGYHISPLLWEKVKKGLSAGRVQSVALRLICEREMQIDAFVPVEYWSVTGNFMKTKKTFEAKLVRFGDKKTTGQNITSQAEVDIILKALKGAKFVVSKIETKDKKKNPTAPFTTSKLQQDAANRLGFNAAKTMQIAQQLYEGIDLGSDRVGLITYMRTDSVRINEGSLAEVREFIKNEYGEKYVPEQANYYKNKKNSQDAHEAVRPSSVLRTPKEVKKYLTGDQYKLYNLIWTKFVSSQMKNALTEQSSVDIEGNDGTFRVTANKTKFDGFLKIYKAGEEDEEEGTSVRLPEMKVGDSVDLLEIEPKQHFTEPPARFTDASIVKRLEESGIGRPSTYAPTINTLIKRYYCQRDKRQLVPTYLGKVVNDIVTDCFPEIVNEEFTAKMEETLDTVEEQHSDWHDIIHEFYPPFTRTLELAHKKVENLKGLMDEPTDYVCERCNRPMVKRLGKFGFFLACTGFPECKNSKPIPLGKCPKPDCTGSVVLKKSKGGKGRSFYACTNYPDCDFVTYFTPVLKECPKCSKALFYKREKGESPVNTCLNPDCGYSEPAN